MDGIQEERMLCSVNYNDCSKKILIAFLLLVVFCFACVPGTVSYADDSYGQEPALEGFNQGISKADKDAIDKIIKELKIDIDPGIKKKAEEFIPADLNEKVNNEINRLTKEVFPQTEEYLRYNSNLKQRQDSINTKTILNNDERIYLFISSSIPSDTLKNYAADLDTLNEQNIKMVLRGFVGGMKYIKPTVDFVRSIIMKDKECEDKGCQGYKVNIIVDPFLYRRYSIKSVPAVVYVKGVRVLNEDITSEGVDSGTAVGDYYALYGDIKLDGALEMINREVKSDVVDKLISKLRNNDGTER